jgi:hypothetical protein
MDELSWIFTPLFTLIGVFIGWFLSNRSQQKMLKITEIRNELEKAYGMLYSIVSKPEEMAKDERTGTEEKRVVVSREEKEELDRILMSYPHMFPLEIVVLWRTEIRNLTAFRFGIPVKFKEKITEEYNKRLEEYYKITGRRKSLEGLPKLARS